MKYKLSGFQLEHLEVPAGGVVVSLFNDQGKQVDEFPLCLWWLPEDGGTLVMRAVGKGMERLKPRQQRAIKNWCIRQVKTSLHSR